MPEEVRWGLAEAGFVFATPIQAATLPVTLAGRDVAGQAQTGTGKTAAFLVTIFSRLLRKPRSRAAHGPRALVIAPTRELVVQIRQDAELLGRHTGLGTLAVFGGVDYKLQRDAVKTIPDLLVGTPADSSTTKVRERRPFATSKFWSSTKPTGCSTWVSFGTSERFFAAVLPTIAARRFCFPPRSSRASWSSLTSTRTTPRKSRSNPSASEPTGSRRFSTTSPRARSFGCSWAFSRRKAASGS